MRPISPIRDARHIHVSFRNVSTEASPWGRRSIVAFSFFGKLSGFSFTKPLYQNAARNARRPFIPNTLYLILFPFQFYQDAFLSSTPSIAVSARPPKHFCEGGQSACRAKF